MKTRTIMIALAVLLLASIAIVAASAWISPYLYPVPNAQPAYAYPASGSAVPASQGTSAGGIGSALGCPGCPGCPGENNTTPVAPGEPICYGVGVNLGCPGCPGCPGGNNTTPVTPGEPICYAIK